MLPPTELTAQKPYQQVAPTVPQARGCRGKGLSALAPVGLETRLEGNWGTRFRDREGVHPFPREEG